MKNNLTIVYKDECFEVCFDEKINIDDGGIKDNIVECLWEAIDSLDVLGDDNLRACGYFGDLYELLYGHDECLLEEFLKNAKVTLDYNGDIREYDVSDYLNDIWEYRYLNDCFDTGRAMNLIVESIELFLKQGEWHVAVLEGPLLESEFKLYPILSTWNEDILKQNLDCETNECRPVFWFGLPSDNIPHACWIIDVYNLIQGDASGGIVACLSSWYNNDYWDEIVANVDSNDCMLGSQRDCMYYCEAEFGISLPYRYQLLKSLPVKIRDDMSKNEFVSEVNKYFLEKIRKVQ